MTARLDARIDPAQCGEANMAADRALWQSVEHETTGAGPRLRIYRWSPPAVSIGFHQDEGELDRAALARDGLSWVRRPTGGGAILHDQELTFAVAAPLPSTASRDMRPLYAWISRAIVAALLRLGVTARCAGAGRPQGIVCFASAGGHEILVGQRKICGSALRRGRRAYLVHGSLLTGPAQARIADYLRAAPSAAELLQRSTDLTREGIDATGLARLPEFLIEEFDRAYPWPLALPTSAA
jgi:lipoate-protein ligase A